MKFFVSRLILVTALFFLVVINACPVKGMCASVLRQVSNSNPLSPTAGFWWLRPCQGVSTIFEDLSTTPSGSSIVSWSWNFGDPNSGANNVSVLQNPMHIFSTPGNYTVFLTVTNSLGQSNSVSNTVEIYQPPTSTFSIAPQTCQGQPVNFTSLAVTPTGFINVWDWNFGDGHVQRVLYPNNPNVSHTYSSPGNYNVSLSVQVIENQANLDSCGSSTTQTISISQPPVANFNYSGQTQNQAVQFTDASVCIGIGTITGWNWDFGDQASGVNNISTLQNPTHTYSLPGNYAVREIATNSYGCQDTIYRPVTIQPAVIDFTFTGQCLGEPTQFTALADPNSAALYNWDFGDGSVSVLSNPTHLYAFAGSFNVLFTFVDTSGNTTTVTHVVTINPNPIAFFSFPAIICSGTAVQFTDLSQTNGGSSLTGWNWNFGDPGSGSANVSTLQNPSHTFTNSGTYSVELTITTSAGCSATTIQQIIVNGSPYSDFTFTTPHLYEAVYFTDLSLPTSGIVSYNWDFGNGSTSSVQNPMVTYTIPGNYIVTLTVATAQGCSNQSDSLLIAPQITGVSGKVIADIQSLTEAVVNLVQIDSLGMPVNIQQTSPGPDSYFHFTNVAPGDYYLQASPLINGPFSSTYLPTFFTSFIYWESATQLNLGSPLYSYEIYLEPYSILLGGAYTINGQLSYPGKSVSPANQEILLLDDQDNQIQWTQTDANGDFSFSSLPAGLYKVYPVIVGYTTYSYLVDLNALTNPAFVKMYITGQTITGLDNPTLKPEFRLYPNPARDRIILELTSGNCKSVAEIFNSTGILCSSIKIVTNRVNIDLQDLPSGLYILKLVNPDGTSQLSRFIKE
ncbi:MAG: PKD domain-containing protein [Bacteroidetes bacterium]|nr:PKD domain-containing protein [Bacteroidota bacterium]